MRVLWFALFLYAAMGLTISLISGGMTDVRYDSWQVFQE